MNDIQEIRNYLIFYPRFPKDKTEVLPALRGFLAGTRITKQSICCFLRHYFTNYDELSRRRLWEHALLREEVNRLILEVVGDDWEDNTKIRRKNRRAKMLGMEN